MLFIYILLCWRLFRKLHSFHCSLPFMWSIKVNTYPSPSKMKGASISFLDNNKPDVLWYQVYHSQISTPAASSHSTENILSPLLLGITAPHPHHLLGSASVRGPKRDLQLFLGLFLRTVAVCYPLAPLCPPSLSLLHLTSFCCPIPQSTFFST